MTGPSTDMQGIELDRPQPNTEKHTQWWASISYGLKAIQHNDIADNGPSTDPQIHSKGFNYGILGLLSVRINHESKSSPGKSIKACNLKAVIVSSSPLWDQWEVELCNAPPLRPQQCNALLENDCATHSCYFNIPLFLYLFITPL